MLSILDTLLYVLLMLFGFCLPFGIAALFQRVTERLAAADPNTVAWSSASLADFVRIFPLFLLGLFGVVFFGALFALRQPIFGRADVAYGYPKDASLYPFFRIGRHNRPPSAAAVRAQQTIKRGFILLLGLCILVVAVSSLGISPRYGLSRDASLTCYNAFNVPVRQYGMSDYTEVSVETFFVNGRYPPTRGTWSVRIRIRTDDGKTYDFYSPRTCAELADLIRSLPPETVVVSGADRLPDVFEHYALTDAETDALLELFGIS